MIVTRARRQVESLEGDNLYCCSECSRKFREQVCLNKRVLTRCHLRVADLRWVCALISVYQCFGISRVRVCEFAFERACMHALAGMASPLPVHSCTNTFSLIAPL